ncbi:MAG: hypothetical protein C0506_12810 [Anaerolinea sp.]|nr:hypothetical protein [Anaerolinea sp.]
MTVSTPANTAIQSLIDRQVAEGSQIGVQVCAYQDGKPVVDAWAGTMGPDDPRPVQPDSLFLSFSTTKGIGALALHMQADKGLIDFDAPVSKYWPAFGKHGKDKITVAQAMSHQAGIHETAPLDWDWDSGMAPHITDWEAGLRWIEESVPAWEPGTATGYHAVTYAWIVGGIVQHATGRHIQEVIHQDIAKPLGISDSMFVGIPDGLDERLATLAVVPAGDGLGLPAASDFHRAMPLSFWQHTNSMAYRKACLPSANGHFTARALARMYAALAGDGSIDGVRLVSPGAIKNMQRLMTAETDRVLGVPVNKGIGFFLGGEQAGIHGPNGPRVTAFGHAGAGGSVAFADPEQRLAVGVTINKMAYPLPGEGTTLEICDLIRKELGAE